MKHAVSIKVTYNTYGWQASAIGYPRVQQISPRTLESAVLKTALLVFFGPYAAKSPQLAEVNSIKLRRYSLFHWTAQCFPVNQLNLLPLSLNE